MLFYNSVVWSRVVLKHILLTLYRMVLLNRSTFQQRSYLRSESIEKMKGVICVSESFEKC